MLRALAIALFLIGLLVSIGVIAFATVGPEILEGIRLALSLV